MTRHYSNGWASAITSAPNAGATSITPASVTGAPATPFDARIRNATLTADGLHFTKEEIVSVTNITTGVATITRASEAIWDGTQSAVDFTGGPAVLEHEFTAGGIAELAGTGSVATDTIWAAAGDLAVGTGADTAAKLAVGADGRVLTVSPSTHVPVWAAPGASLGSTSFTSNAGITSHTEASGDTVVTAPALSFSGSDAVYVEFYCPKFSCPLGSNTSLFLFDGATSLGKIAELDNPDGSYESCVPCFVRIPLTPSSGSHTFSVRGIIDQARTAYCQAGAGGAGNLWPGYIRVVMGA